jgi:hypothetical protein
MVIRDVIRITPVTYSVALGKEVVGESGSLGHIKGDFHARTFVGVAIEVSY